MKRLAIAALAWMFTLAAVLCPAFCSAQRVCPPLVLRGEIEVGPGALSLADLLPPDGCGGVYQAAAHVSLGAAPLPGSVREFSGVEIRRLLNGLGDAAESFSTANIPDRIALRRAGNMKSCSEVAKFVAAANPALFRAEGFAGENLNCAAARGVPRSADLELNHTEWDPALRRWEFALRCTLPAQCVPFMVWARSTKSVTGSGAYFYPDSDSHANAAIDHPRPAVKRGDTATLTWEQAGIRVVLPVTCLEPGAVGQFVRVRFQNVATTLRAEVVGAGTLRINL